MEDVYMVFKSKEGSAKEKLVVIFDIISNALDFIDTMEYNGTKYTWWIDAANYNPIAGEWSQFDENIL